ncbi:YciI family protein [Streptomyces bluensis]|uniref:YciI family protein n=1 Tax=Streptomyces bluensis TaxID=33897 RepID=A0ABW6UGI7_9ACTN
MHPGCSQSVRRAAARTAHGPAKLPRLTRGVTGGALVLHGPVREGADRSRGPTFADDGETPTGSVHIVDLPDPAAARAFAFDEPTYQAGAYRDVLLRRWRNVLGRTMWDFPGDRSGGNRYLVLGLGEGQAADLALPPDQDELIAYGPLLSDDGDTWLGTAVLLTAPDPDTARAALSSERYADIEAELSGP